MGEKFCTVCKKVVETKVCGEYSQVEYRGIPVKKRKIGHLKEDGGCGHEWFTLEVPEEFLTGKRSDH